jgi:serine/threonine-protein kinase
MMIRKFAVLGALVLGTVALHGLPVTAHAQEGKADDLSVKAEAILKKHCAECHSKKIKKPKGDLDLWNPAHLSDKEREVVVLVPGSPEKSGMIQRLRPKEASALMPPKKNGGPLGDDEVKILTAWVKAGGKYAGAVATRAGEEKPAEIKQENNGKNNGKNNEKPPVQPPPVVKGGVPAGPAGALAAEVKELFRARCFACHGGDRGTEGNVVILDYGQLTTKKKVLPGNADGSKLFKLITANDDSVMPPGTEPRLSAEQTEIVRKWIAAGAPAFPADVARPVEEKKDGLFKDVSGVDYVLTNILAHVRNVPEQDRPFIRYISINHILTTGATPAELDRQRGALFKAVNHMTWEKQLARLEPIDRANSVYAIDLRAVGWHKRPFTRRNWQGKEYRSYLNRYDLALLEYPYSVHYQDSDKYERIAREYMYPINLVRPIPYVRSDWFCSVVTQPPLYEDVMDLPLHASVLEHRLGVDVKRNIYDYVAKRSGMAVSGVSRNNRVVEWHRSLYGSYWKSYDFKTSKGEENMFKDPIDLHEVGGEYVFTLPNGLHGYYVSDAKGNRIEVAPQEIVIDKFASDKAVRNGLACMRCHDAGVKPCTDTVRPALERMRGSLTFEKRDAERLYVPQKEFAALIDNDRDSFMRTMERVLGRPQTEEPLIPVSRRFLDDAITLENAAGELGFHDGRGLQPIFSTREFSALGLVPLAAPGGKIRRDSWEDYFDQAVRGLNMGTPIVPIDGVTKRDYLAPLVSHYVKLATNQKGNTFRPGDKMIINVKNTSKLPVYIEVFGTGVEGNKHFVSKGVVSLAAGGTWRFPEKGDGITIKPKLGKEQITLYASYKYFPPGEIHRGEYDRYTGKYGVQRVVHPFYTVKFSERKMYLTYDAYDVAKKTIDIDTK